MPAAIAGHSNRAGCCRCIAVWIGLFEEGLWHAFLDGVSDTSDRLAYVKRSFADFEIRMETPYLNPGSVDHYPPLEDL